MQGGGDAGRARADDDEIDSQNLTLNHALDQIHAQFVDEMAVIGRIDDEDVRLFAYFEAADAFPQADGMSGVDGAGVEKYVKKEGDGKAPAGIFQLKQAFGYQPFVIKYPYEVYRSTDHCVDDIHSKFYNKIVDSSKIKADYKSFEHMKFPKDYYKYGIVVNHNHIDEEGAMKGAGSCIFIHIKNIPTAGCTVMSESELKEIIKWLDAESEPLLVQGTEDVVNDLMKEIK